MAATERGALAEDLRRARSQFQSWRKQRQPGCRIPPHLWALAVRLVATHGLSRTAAALGLDYYSLKKQVAAADEPARPNAPAFVEVPAPVGLGKQALVELTNRAGATLRVQLLGYDAADLEALVHHFWKAP
jgi:hypothetical protein